MKQTSFAHDLPSKTFCPDGNFAKGRVFLDLGATCSFIAERLAQQVRLLGLNNNTMISGIVGVNAMRAHGAVSFMVGHVHNGGNKIRVEDAFVLTRVTTDMPGNLVESIDKWKHLADLDLSDPARLWNARMGQCIAGS